MVFTTRITRRRRKRNLRKQRNHNLIYWVWTIALTSIFILIVLPFSILIVFLAFGYTNIVDRIPDNPQDSFNVFANNGSIEFYDRYGQVLFQPSQQHRFDEQLWLDIEDIPGNLVNATLISEDPNFLNVENSYSLHVTLTRILLSFWEVRFLPDSTITGRLVRNILIPFTNIDENTNTRIQEYILVSELNHRYSPEDILEWYLNTSDYGNGIYGIDRAAKHYFGKSTIDLSLDESALLAAIPTAPWLNPTDNLIAARGRQADILRNLYTNDLISEKDLSNALSIETHILFDTEQHNSQISSYIGYARQQVNIILENQGYDTNQILTSNDLVITTTLDMALHEKMVCMLQVHLSQLSGSDTPDTNSCTNVDYLLKIAPLPGTLLDDGVIVVIDANTGELLAAIGDIISRKRQPGPILRPFVYLSGLISGYTPAHMLLDIPLRFPGNSDGLYYTPSNLNNQYLGPISLRTAMNLGLLTPAVQIAYERGLDDIILTTKRIGMSSLDINTFDLTLLEQGGSVSVLDATYAYSVFATLGDMYGINSGSQNTTLRLRNPVAVLKIENREGQILWEYNRIEQQKSKTSILEPGLAYLVNHILADISPRTTVMEIETDLQFPRPAALTFGKTSSEDSTWALGYSPNIVLGIWLGDVDELPVTLSAYALDETVTVWQSIMEYIHNYYNFPDNNWQQPLNVVEARVCQRSGMRPNGVCPEKTEIFLEGTQPTEVDTHWHNININTQTGLLTTANTPTSLQEQRLFFIPPDEALQWWLSNNFPLPPQKYDTVTRPDLVRSTVIFYPGWLDYVRDIVDIQGSIDINNLQHWQLTYGKGINPESWIDLNQKQTDYIPGEILTQWDTNNLDGLYSLRLTAVLNDNSIDPYVVQVTVDNIPPNIILKTSVNKQNFTFLENGTISLVADTQDNIAIDRVEFYHNGEFVGVDDVFPFGYEHPINRVGFENFSAVVFDRAGNQSNSQLTAEIRRGDT